MPNRLARSQSLYLRKHADNPIDWWYWCDEALAIAQAQDKPIFLSIGYSSCHWCTVMEGEAFSDEAIADYLNTHFLPIKVDREERPDLDSIYMQALQMMTGQGGWPLNIFLTPDERVPFYGGTYFPIESRFNRPAFLEILKAIRHFYDTEKEKLKNIKDEILNGLKQTIYLPLDNTAFAPELLYRGIETNTAVLERKITQIHQPSFPMIPYANLALQGSRFRFESRYDGNFLSIQRGEDLALGGICDHVGGGFHRYTVDATWTVPHFEKMLYDNGQIVEYLANLWSKGQQEPAFQRAIAKTVQWLQREMTAPQGYFYAAQDADNFTNAQESEPEEGEFYVWKYAELTTLLTADALKTLEETFLLTPEGNFEGSNVLQRRQGGELSLLVENILEILFTARYGQKSSELTSFPAARNNRDAKSLDWLGRIPPVTDTKMIVAWNSLMISGLARAYAVFKIEQYWELATKAINFILEHQWVQGRLHRLNYEGNPSVLAQSEDYALIIKALLDLQSACPQDTQWLEKAMDVQQEFDHYFSHPERGGYYNNAADNCQDILIREQSYIDNATPSANGIAIANLIRLGHLTSNTTYFTQAEQGLRSFHVMMKKSPQACPSLLTALDWYFQGNLVRAKIDALNVLVSQYHPTVCYRFDTQLPQAAVAMVCERFSCLEPAKTLEDLLNQLQPYAQS